MITEEMTINDVIMKHPETVDVFQELGIHCFGCHAAAFEPLGAGLRGHGMDEDKIKEVLKKLNETLISK